MKILTIGKRIIYGFTAVVVINACLGLFSLSQLRNISTIATGTTVESIEGMDCIGRIASVAQENNLLLVKDLMTKNEDLRADLEKQLQNNLIQMDSITAEYQKSKHSTNAKTALGIFVAAQKAYIDSLNQTLALVRDGKTPEAMALKQNKVDPFLVTIQAEEQSNKQNGQAAIKQVQSTASQTQISIVAVFIAMLLAAVFIAFAITGGISRALGRVSGALNDGANQVSAAANQVSSSSQSLAEGASEQAASIEETSASLTEISSTTEHNTQTVQSTKEFTVQTRQAAEQGAESTQRMNTSIDGIKAASQKMGGAMDAIKTASKDIANIIKTIDEIAFQTNLLALNAAVEAARAGEAGAGFAVVADEVRNLAQRSAKAAKETAAMIETAIGRSDAGVAANQEVVRAVEGVVRESTEVAGKLNDIVIKIHQVDEQVAQIAVASKEQSQGIGQISSAVSEMEKITQSNASGAEESAAAAEELKAQSETLKASVRELQALVDGGKKDLHPQNPKARGSKVSRS